LLRLLLLLLLFPAATAQEWRQPFFQLLQWIAALRLLATWRCARCTCFGQRCRWW